MATHRCDPGSVDAVVRIARGAPTDEETAALLAALEAVLARPAPAVAVGPRRRPVRRGPVVSRCAPRRGSVWQPLLNPWSLPAPCVPATAPVRRRDGESLTA